MFLGPPPFRHRYGIRILLAKHDAQSTPTQALKTELGELKLTLGNVQSKSSSETRSIVGFVVGLGSGESQMTGMTWVLGNRVNTYAKVTDWYQMIWFLFDWDHKVLTISFTSYLDSPRKLREMLARTASSIQVEVESTWHPMFLVRPML